MTRREHADAGANWRTGGVASDMGEEQQKARQQHGDLQEFFQEQSSDCEGKKATGAVGRVSKQWTG